MAMKDEIKKAIMELRHERDQRQAKLSETLGTALAFLFVFAAGVATDAGYYMSAFIYLISAAFFAVMTDALYGGKYRIRRVMTLEPKENAKSGK